MQLGDGCGTVGHGSGTDRGHGGLSTVKALDKGPLPGSDVGDGVRELRVPLTQAVQGLLQLGFTRG